MDNASAGAACEGVTPPDLGSAGKLYSRVLNCIH